VYSTGESSAKGKPRVQKYIGEGPEGGLFGVSFRFREEESRLAEVRTEEVETPNASNFAKVQRDLFFT
jgi:hypothetical protein